LSEVQVAAESGYNEVGKLYSTEAVVPAISCFAFKINDGWGDGICCGQGNGYYRVYIDNSLEVSGGQFGKEETKTFGDCA